MCILSVLPDPSLVVLTVRKSGGDENVRSHCAPVSVFSEYRTFIVE
jgi:hypothetical protein